MPTHAASSRSTIQRRRSATCRRYRWHRSTPPLELRHGRVEPGEEHHGGSSQRQPTEPARYGGPAPSDRRAAARSPRTGSRRGRGGALVQEAHGENGERARGARSQRRPNPEDELGSVMGFLRRDSPWRQCRVYHRGRSSSDHGVPPATRARLEAQNGDELRRVTPSGCAALVLILRSTASGWFWSRSAATSNFRSPST